VLRRVSGSGRFVLVPVSVLCALAGGLLFSSAPALAAFTQLPSFGSEGSGPEQFGNRSPFSVAVDDSTGDVFALDRGNRRIEVFSAEGKELPGFEFIGLAGVFSGETSGLAVDNSTDPGDPSKGDVYVTDSGNGVVDKFKLVTPEKYELEAQLPASAPRGVAVDSKGDVYVADAFGPAGVREFEPTGKELPEITNDGGPNEFTFLGGVAVAPNGDLYVLNGFSGESVLKLTLTARNEVEDVLPVGNSGAAVAVDSNGNVYIAQNAPLPHVEEYGPNRVFLEEFGSGDMGESSGIAFSPFNGDVYVADSERHEVHRFKEVPPVAPFKPAVTGCSAKSSTPVGETVGCAIVPNAGEATWYVEYEEVGSGTLTSTGMVNTIKTTKPTTPVEANETLGGLKPDTRYRYVLFAENKLKSGLQFEEGTFTTTPPVVGVGPCSASPISPTENEGVTLHGALKPEGIETSWHFKYGLSTAYESETGVESSGSTEEVQPKPNLHGLKPHTSYYCQLVATNKYGSTSGEGGQFTTTGTPILGGEFVSEVGTQSATVNVHINDEGLPGEYQVAYGTTPGSSSFTTQLLPVPPSGDVEANLSNLTEGTVYYYRVLVTDEHGTSLGTTAAGAEATFTTFTTSASALPDSRVYEMVTPAANQNANIYVPVTGEPPGGGSTADQTRRPFQASADGNAVAYVGDPNSSGSGNEGEGSGNEFLATRAAMGGWTQVDIQPPGYVSPTYQAFSSDLSMGILDSCESRLPPLSDEAPGGGYDVLYFRVSSDGGYHALFTTTPPNRSSTEFAAAGVAGKDSKCGLGSLAYAGASSDLSHLLFEANDVLLEGGGRLEKELEEDVKKEVAEGKDGNNLYESAGGQLHLVNVLPDGAPDPNATFGSPPSGSPNEPPDFSHVISTDGSRIFWTDLNTGDLYLRANGTATVPVSAGAATFWTASPDGKYAFYTEGEKLWRFDVEGQAGHEREVLAAEGVQGVVGINETGEDSSYVYFVATGRLASNENANTEKAEAGKDNLYLLHEGVTTFIAMLSPADDVNGGNAEGLEFGDWRPGLGSRTAEVTPDGHSLVFMSQRSLTGYDNTGYSQNESGTLEAFTATEVYVYDADAGHVFCASCDPSGEPPSIRAGTSASYLPVNYSNTYLPRWISEDGSRVFFDSAEPLAPTDTNGKQDVYEWEREGAGSCDDSRGCVYLLSGATSTDASFFIDASANGNDVFIVTRAQLVAEDQNGNFNLFDARVGGVQPLAAAACSGTGCQGVPPALPIFVTPSSVTFNGVGNFASSPPAAKPKAKPLTRAQKLAKALKACKKRDGSRRGERATCEAHVKKRYGAKPKAKKTAKGRK